MNRLTRWTAFALLLCTLVATPIGSATAQDDGQAQLDATASAMLALNSFHFKLETTDGKTVFQDAFELKIVEGDVVRPANFQAALDVKLAIVDLTLEVVSVDGSIWVKNPIGGGDSFIQVAGGDSEFQLPPMEFLNPDSLVQEALRLPRRSADCRYGGARRTGDDRAHRHVRSGGAHVVWARHRPRDR